MQRTQRLNRELTKMKENPPQGICVFAKDDKFNVLEAQISGPENTPYSSGVFKVEINVPDRYPFSPPSIKFTTKIYHPNVDDNGRICMNLLKMPPIGGWKPTMSLEGLLIAVRMLLEIPNPDDPLMLEIAKEFKEHNDVFLAKAKQYTERYASTVN